MNRIYYSACITVACTLAGCYSNNPEQKNQASSPGTLNISRPVFIPDPAGMLPVVNYQKLYEKRITQHFTVSHQQKTVVTGKKGLKVTIIPGRLQTVDKKPVSGSIEVSIIELTSSMDLFRCNAATVSNGKLLSSGGSYFIGMSCNGKELQIKPGESLPVDLPVLKNNDMELFYGERDESENMNWQAANVSFTKKQDENLFLYGKNNDFEYMPLPYDTVNYSAFTKLFRTMDDKVYYYSKLTTIKNAIDSINRYKKKLVIDTVNMWPALRNCAVGNCRIDTNYLTQIYGPRYQYMVLKADIAEARKKAKEKRDSLQKVLVTEWKPQTIQGQLQKYYTTTPIRYLGWINCDRFYKQEQTNTEVDPMYVSGGKVEYFLIFKGLNGLVNGSLTETNRIIGNLPVGESVIIVAFTKKENEIFESRQEFVINKKPEIRFDFKKIEKERLKEMFGANISI